MSENERNQLDTANRLDKAALELRLEKIAEELGADLNKADDRQVCEDLLRQEQWLGGRRQFPVDAVCERIVRELERRGWLVPGIKVEFSAWEKNLPVKRQVSSIAGTEFAIESWMGLHIDIPRKKLYVYDDEGGHVFYLYVGENWERDRETFRSGPKFNSKLEGRPKMYLVYKGACDCQREDAPLWLRSRRHTHPGQRPPLLVSYNDLEREYDPEGDEPTSFRTDEVLEEFRQYLENVVLPMIVDLTGCK